VSRWSGRLEHRDLEGGVWMLHARGETFTLRGKVPADLDGKQVEVEGEADDGFGFDMAGPAIAVRTVRKA
jgi:hypothetical protein